MTNAQWTFLRESLTPLVYLAAIALLVIVLVQAKVVLVPIALAFLPTFMLTPLVEALERRRSPRIVAVLIVVLFALSVIGGFGYVLTSQFNDLAMKLPHYSTSIREKFATLRASGKGVISNIEKTVEQVSRELDKQEQQQQQKENPTVDPEKNDPQKCPTCTNRSERID
jgi:predicted PurR-regulated permease PerM